METGIQLYIIKDTSDSYNQGLSNLLRFLSSIRDFRPGNIFAMPDLDENEANGKEDEDEQPSTSKKRRICE